MNLKTNLMTHQQKAVNKMMPTRIGALFMEMGTGKTRTAIEIINRRQAKVSKVVWFCPVSLKTTIYNEIIKHTDSSREIIHVFDSKTNQKNIPDAFWYIVGIESMSLSKRVIFAINKLIDMKSFVIVDESSFIKGHRAARTCWITDLSEKARFRMILTGTPVSQGVVDLFAQFRFLSPKILGYNSFYSFAANHLEYSKKFKGQIVRAHNTEFIAAKIKPYVYQVTKQECIDLPQKIYETVYFPMTEGQRHYYKQVKEEVLSVDAEDWSIYTVFQLFSRLQQIVSGFLNHYEGVSFKHKRISALINIIENIPLSEKIIIWCKYENDIENIAEALCQKDTALFYGKIKPNLREEALRQFKSEKRFLVATESCGGYGLTLNEANYVIFYNNGFKYAERLQAEDRSHRIGQTMPVTYIDIICENSIDERIFKALQEKSSVVDSFKEEVDAVKDDRVKFQNMIRGL